MHNINLNIRKITCIGDCFGNITTVFSLETFTLINKEEIDLVPNILGKDSVYDPIIYCKKQQDRHE